MPYSSQDTTAPAVLPAVPPGCQDFREQEVLPRLPPGWQDQAKRLKAFSRARQLRSAADMLRGILAYVLCVRSFRHLGCWSVLIGLADVSEAAWRKRLRQARAWLAQLPWRGLLPAEEALLSYSVVKVRAYGTCPLPGQLVYLSVEEIRS